ncbi:MAG: hypothetical protein JST51_18915 [Armatimonadetes bacterium]|nr:hypothetical protein [Armatimonadota bacterium]
MAKESLRELLEFYRDHVHQVRKDRYLACSRWTDKLGHGATEEARNRATDDMARLHPEYVRKNDLLDAMTPSLLELRNGAPRDIDRAIDLCEVDVIAFRIGYKKAAIYQVLKTLDLSESQKRRIQMLGISYVTWPGQRREMRELGRLLIVVADQEFVLRLVDISENPLDLNQRRKADILLYKILNSRTDLRNRFELPKLPKRY